MENNQLIIQKKQTAWANYALESHNKLAELQTESAKVVANLSDLPTKIEQIAEAEKVLKESKAKQKEIAANRLAQTSKLDGFFEKFMAPEKQVLAAIPAYEQAIIKLKNDKAALDNLQANKDAEAKRIKETFIIHINNSKAKFETLIADIINKQFTYAVTNAKDENTIIVLEEEIPLTNYLFKCMGVKKASDFIISMPAVTVNYETDVNAIWDTMEKVYLDGLLMKGKFEGDLKDKFKYFSIAIKDKERAIANSEKVANESKEQIAAQTDQQNIGAKLSVNATVMSQETTTKALKEKFELDMASSQENALLVIAAFVANIQKTASHVRVKDWMKLSIEQMGKALESVKNEDNNFTVTSINFKVTQKL